MIGWYVDIGYSFTTDLTSISDIVFTDLHVPFGIPVLDGAEIEKGVTYYLGPDATEAFFAVSAHIGDQANALWPYFGATYREKNPDISAVESLAGVFPSIRVAYPNLYKAFLAWMKDEIGSSTDDFVPIIYFKENKRISIPPNNPSVGSYMYVYSTDDDGSVSLIHRSVSTSKYFFPWVYEGILAFAVLNEYIPGTTDYRKTSNYQSYNLFATSTAKEGYSVRSNVNKLSNFDAYMAALFPDITKGPDFILTPEINPEDPYKPVEPSGPSQPTDPSAPGYVPPGTFDDSSDSIPDSSLPTLSAANTGFTRIYNPTLAQVQNLARYLWTDDTLAETIWNKIKQFIENPIEAIIGFNLVPVKVPDGGTEEFKLMYIPTGVNMTVAANQFVDVDCGTVKLERYYGSALDQSPYTRVSAFLPFIGTVHLNTDEIMGTTLRVKYRVDICSGSCVAKILVDENVLYQYSGHCAITIPITSSDFSSYVQAAISVARLVAGAAVGGIGGAIGASASAPDPNQQTSRVVTINRMETTTVRNPSTGRQITSGTSNITETRSYPIKQSNPQDTTQASFDALSPANIANTVGAIMSSKPVIEHAGSFSGNSGYLGIRRPYLIIERPNMCLPDQYQHFNGYPSMITMTLSECKGYTRIQQVELTGMTATNPEQAEIMSLLKSGVYF